MIVFEAVLRLCSDCLNMNLSLGTLAGKNLIWHCFQTKHLVNNFYNKFYKLINSIIIKVLILLTTTLRIHI